MVGVEPVSQERIYCETCELYTPHNDQREVDPRSTSHDHAPNDMRWKSRLAGTDRAIGWYTTWDGMIKNCYFCKRPCNVEVKISPTLHINGKKHWATCEKVVTVSRGLCRNLILYSNSDFDSKKKWSDRKKYAIYFKNNNIIYFSDRVRRSLQDGVVLHGPIEKGKCNRHKDRNKNAKGCRAQIIFNKYTMYQHNYYKNRYYCKGQCNVGVKISPIFSE
jgi:hypothetical protein